jgi:transposase
MASMASDMPSTQSRVVFGGIDTHKDIHVAALLDSDGGLVASASFGTTRAGYRQLQAWLSRAGTVARVGVEGTGSYGAGVCRELSVAGIEVVEVNRPDRAERRRRGKSDVLDAAAAAEAARTSKRIAIPKSRDGQVESVRVLKLNRTSAVQARTKAFQQIDQLIVTAPAPLRDQLRDLAKMRLIRCCAASRPEDSHAADPAVATRIALKNLARRYLELNAEIRELDKLLKRLATELAPQLSAVSGIGADTAAQLLITVGDNPGRIRSEGAFAMLCGVAPLPASSGKTQRHRLNRGGDRQANRALHVIATTRKRSEPRTQTYIKNKIASGHTKQEATRSLKRLIAREVYYLLLRPHNDPDSSIQATLPERSRGQGGAPHARNDLDRAEHRHTIKNGGTGPLTNREAS